jgi:hypothetical protein
VIKESSRSDALTLHHPDRRTPLVSWLVLWAAAFTLVAFLLPNHYPPWQSFHSELAAAFAFAPLAVWAVFRGGQLPALTLGGLLLAMVPIAQLGFGEIYFSGDAWITSLYLSGFALVVLAGARWEHVQALTKASLEGLAPLWIGFMLAGYASVGIAAHQWLGTGWMGIYGAELPPGGRAFANLAQPNLLATLLLMAIAAHIALFEIRRIAAGSALAGVALLVFGLALTGSRSVMLALVWFLPAYGFMRRRCRLRLTQAGVASACLLFIAITISLPSISRALLIAGPSSAVDRMETVGVRLVYWQSMVDAIGRAPWLGYGWSQIGVAQAATVLDYPATRSYFDSSHNLFLDLMLWNGLPIGMLVIVGLLSWLVSQVHRCRDASTWSALMAVGFVFSHAMVEYPLNYAFFLLPVGFLMGVLVAAHPTRADGPLAQGKASPVRLTLVVVAVAALAALIKVASEYPAWEQDWRFLRYQEARIGDPLRAELPEHIMLTQLDELMTFSRTDVRPDMSAAELEWMRRVSLRFGHASVMYRYALALGVNGRVEEATLALRRLCAMHSTSLCRSARQNWMEAGQKAFPQLATIPFPLSTPSDRTAASAVLQLN